MMSFCTYSLLRRMRIRNGQRAVTTAATKQIQMPEIESFRTLETHPPNHVTSHLNKIYTLPTDIESTVKNHIPIEWRNQTKIFGECGILIRKPAVEIMSYLEQTDYTKPINKYVLYGITGAGKTVTLFHLVHYGLAKRYFLLHLPWVSQWFKFPKDHTDSVFMPGLIDLPTHAGEWLKYIKKLNESLLSELDLKVSKDYTWTQRECTKSGEPITNLIEFGIQRNKFACGVIDALINELKAASTAGKCRILFIVDGFNALTCDHTRVPDDNKVYVPPSRISLTKTFLSCMDYDWCNGAAILSVDILANKFWRESEYPRYLLGKEGFELLDPFLPVRVENYTIDEFNTMIDYFKDRKWIRKISEEGKRELELLSNKNPYELWHRCKPL